MSTKKELKKTLQSLEKNEEELVKYIVAYIENLKVKDQPMQTQACKKTVKKTLDLTNREHVKCAFRKFLADHGRLAQNLYAIP
jgi:type VI protein secretion system component Hcp